jgi:hypothetical protein
VSLSDLLSGPFCPQGTTIYTVNSFGESYASVLYNALGLCVGPAGTHACSDYELLRQPVTKDRRECGCMRCGVTTNMTSIVLYSRGEYDIRSLFSCRDVYLSTRRVEERKREIIRRPLLRSVVFTASATVTTASITMTLLLRGAVGSRILSSTRQR